MRVPKAGGLLQGSCVYAEEANQSVKIYQEDGGACGTPRPLETKITAAVVQLAAFPAASPKKYRGLAR